MRKLLLLVLGFALSGCSENVPMAGTPESCRATLMKALDGWKSGLTYQDFSSQSPPLFFIDDDLRRGTKLLDYQPESEARPSGTGYSFVITLKVQDAGGKTRTKKVAYTAVTEPKHVVSREDRQP